MNKIQRQVLEFHKKFVVPILLKPGFPSEARRKLRVELIREEFEELNGAIADENIVEAADALGDLLYVVFGAAVEFGIDLEPVVDEIHRSNMTKLGVDGCPIVRGDGKVLKSARYEPPDVAAVLRRQEL